jgi:hypothetical protein
MTCSSASQWFSQGISISSTNKTDYHDITEILLKVVLNTITLKLTPLTRFWFQRIYFYFQVLHIIQRLTDLPISVDVLQVQIYHVSNCIGGVIVRVLALNAVNRGFEPGSCQDCEIDNCCISNSLRNIKKKEQRPGDSCFGSDFTHYSYRELHKIFSHYYFR